MRLVSFMRDGAAGYGVLDGDRVLDWSRALRASHPDLKAVIGDLAALDRLRTGSSAASAIDRRALTLLPPIPNPSKIFCIGHNYEEHRVETGRPKTDRPAVFTRFADTQVAHGQDAWLPQASTDLDFEGEMAVIIGRGGRRISRQTALDHVAGYACYDDMSVRDWQRHTSQFTPGKNFPRTGGFGPAIVTADEIPDPQTLDLTTRVNGEVMQHANTAQMIFSVAELIEYLSAFTPLSPGDVIVSGTPGGVGARRTPPLFLKAGDVVEIEIQSIGVLRNNVVVEPESP